MKRKKRRVNSLDDKIKEGLNCYNLNDLTSKIMICK